MHLLLVSLVSLTTLFVNLPQQTTWKVYRSSEGEFSAAMPADTRTSTIVTYTSKGPVHTSMVSANDHDLNEYLVSWTTYDRNVEYKGTDKVYDRVRDALISSKDGKLISESTITWFGHSARAITFVDSDKRIVKARFYFIGRRFYQVMAEARTEANSADVDKFFDSFKVAGS
jgi:hypothetical protein